MFHRKFLTRFIPRVCSVVVIALSVANTHADTLDDSVAAPAPVGPTLISDAPVQSLPLASIDKPTHGPTHSPTHSDRDGAPEGATVSAADTSINKTVDKAIDGFGIALESTQLEDQRGGADLGPAQPLSGIFTTGVVGDNRAVDVATGSNAIRDGAFSNASGIPVVIQNTGANVLIQSATIVNVQLH